MYIFLAVDEPDRPAASVVVEEVGGGFVVEVFKEETRKNIYIRVHYVS